MTDLSEIKQYSELIAFQADVLGDKPYILHEDQRISFAEYDQNTCRVVNGLYEHGAQPGDGLGILMANCPEYYYLFYTLFCALYPDPAA